MIFCVLVIVLAFHGNNHFSNLKKKGSPLLRVRQDFSKGVNIIINVKKSSV